MKLSSLATGLSLTEVTDTVTVASAVPGSGTITIDTVDYTAEAVLMEAGSSITSDSGAVTLLGTNPEGHSGTFVGVELDGPRQRTVSVMALGLGEEDVDGLRLVESGDAS